MSTVSLSSGAHGEGKSPVERVADRSKRIRRVLTAIVLILVALAQFAGLDGVRFIGIGLAAVPVAILVAAFRTGP